MSDWFEWLKYVLLGMIQGFTEPIPVSSSGHLMIAQQLMGMEQHGLSFEIMTNTASLIAIIFIYREMLARLVTNGFGYIKTKDAAYKPDFNFIMYIIIGSIPAGVIGVLFKDKIEEIFSSSIYTVAIALLVTGVALWLIRNLRGVKRDGDLSVKDALLVGLAQAVALIPGISRSGSTVIASIAVGMKQDTALRFSFMLYIPVSLGGLILGVSDIISDPELQALWFPYLLAFITTLFVTYFSMKWFMGIMEKGNLRYFSYYCFIVGTLILIFM
ncbi:MAG: undecaprenyl-diphosphate phosphatase [Candidatus Pristimantibacillus lignocellulolyticus]|uniref:Undecaprenyl-diphosphatase n=1 Tax=Candidatus Pristimantibacillus lignocellulolyticus TaxID=2994561 RepID=A0A9J6ZGE2_9BACL|nr:MAG: undecaprenyl-diphosphate phosphatase [Candidatus Pristimantibacillus lignocellulolyticus]